MATITLTKMTVAANAPSGATVGVFNVAGLRFTANGNPYGYFLLAGTSLLVAWNGQAMPDKYTIVVNTPGGVPTSFVVTITAPVVAPPPAVPVSVTLTPPSVTLPDNSLAGANICSLAVKMSDGSPFTGTLVINPSGTVALAGSNLVLSRALAATDDGAHSFTITASQNLVSAQATLALSVIAAPVPVITVLPVAPTIPDTTSKGAVVATYSITMSDGSPFTGTVAFGAPNFDNGGVFSLVISSPPSTGQIIVNPNGPGVGPNSGTITDHITLVATS